MATWLRVGADVGAAEPPKPAAAPEGADDAAPAPKSAAVDARLWGRLRAQAVPDFPLDAIGTRNDQTAWYESRVRGWIRWAPTEVFEVQGEADALSGIVTGDRTGVGTALGDETLLVRRDERFGMGVAELRQLFVRARIGFFDLRVGRIAATWGTGLIANSGEGEPDFGDRRHGDLMDRIALAARPFAASRGAAAQLRALTFFASADSVARDEQADWERGDRAYQVSGAALSVTDDFGAGVLQSVRWQTDRHEPQHPERAATTLRSYATDVWIRGVVARLSTSRVFRAEAEGVMVRGHTDRSYLVETRDGSTLRGWAGVARLRYDDSSLRLTVKNELGFASGDNDPYDDTARTFGFDPDYGVGLVLFDQVLGRLSARAIDRASDPSLVAVPTSGLRYLATQGAVTNALYMNPVAKWKVTEGSHGGLEVRLGYLMAFSAADLIDPYSSAARGGYNTTYGKRTPGSRALGHEVDGAARYGVKLPGGVSLGVGAEGGVLLPGPAFDGVGLGTVWTARGLGDVRW